MRQRLRTVGVAVPIVCLIALLNAPVAAQGATATTLAGTITAAGKPLVDAKVTLFAASRQSPTQLGETTTNASGAFSMSYTAPSSGVLYVDATPVASIKLRLRTVVGVVGSTLPTSVTVNELTTVAAGYALAQFSDGDDVGGPSPGLDNAAATTANLTSATTGKAGAVVTNDNNGSKNETLAILNTLANLVSRCAPSSAALCDQMLKLATPPGGSAPADTVEAVVELARNPTLEPAKLYALARGVALYQPALSRPVTAWMLTLLFTDTNLYASGRIAIDAKGNVWSSNNWLPGTQTGSTYVTVLNPVGQPTFGSPLNGAGMTGGAWGAMVMPSGDAWFGSFGGAAMVQYSGTGQAISPSTGWTNNGLFNHPQGVAVDQKNNIWIANNYGPESAPGAGNVIVYQGGDPNKPVTITGGGLNHPFAVQIDGSGRAWVTNAGPGGAKLVGTRLAPLIGKFAGSITVIGPDFKPTSFSPINNSAFKWPLGISIDSKNNAWVANYFGSTVTQTAPSGTVTADYKLPKGTLPWSEAVDGSDRVWVFGFARPNVWLLCGVNTSACPPGSSTGSILSPRDGFHSSAIQHITSGQIDQSGNIWISNNWSNLVPPVGGTGIAEIIGVATPVCTPLLPLPVKPSASAETPCPPQTATQSSASGGSNDSSGTSVWVWVAIAAGVVLVVAIVLVLVRRRHVRA